MKKVIKCLAVFMLTSMVVCVAGCGGSSGNPQTAESPTVKPQNLNGHNYVDLGLPNGTLWATCNLGADSPEGYGDYYAWGETQTKNVYDWKTYKHCEVDPNEHDDGYWNHIAKYTIEEHFIRGDFRRPDNLVVLQAEDDAASVNWGSGWHIPTVDEWNELVANCSQKWTTRNHVKGVLFTGKNGNSMFLPAGGMRSNADLPRVDDFGGYLTSSLCKYNADHQSFFFLFSRGGDGSVGNGERCEGGSVRPVCVRTQY